MATISVVIPALNDAVLLRDCLSALAAQTRAPDEIIVVDNGSTDDTAAVAIAGGARVVSEPVKGIFSATAAGFDAASGDILARLDADSRPMPGWIERIERTLAEQNGLVAVTGPGEFYGAGPVKRALGRAIWIGGMFWFTELVLGHPMVFGSNYAMPAEIWRRVRGTVNRGVLDVHDDLDLSWHFEPDMDVLYDRGLIVQISARPFDSFGSLWRRVSLVWSTLSLDFAEQSPSSRRRARNDWADAQELELPRGENPGLVA